MNVGNLRKCSHRISPLTDLPTRKKFPILKFPMESEKAHPNEQEKKCEPLPEETLCKN